MQIGSEDHLSSQFLVSAAQAEKGRKGGLKGEGAAKLAQWKLDCPKEYRASSLCVFSASQTPICRLYLLWAYVRMLQTEQTRNDLQRWKNS